MRNILSIIIILGSIAAFVLVVQPQYKEIKNLQAKAVELEGVLVNARKLQSIRDELLDKRDSLVKSDLARLEKMVPESVDNVKLILELQGIADRSDYDLKQHQKFSKTKMEVLDEETKESLVSISPTQVNVSFRDQEQVSNLNEMFTETFSATGQEIKSGISSGISTLLNILSTLVAFLPLMIFAGFLLSRGMFLVVEIIMVWLVLKLYQRISNIGYVVRLSLHLLIIAEIPHQLGNMLGLVLPFSLLSLSFWVLLAFVVLQLEKQPTKR